MAERASTADPGAASGAPQSVAALAYLRGLDADRRIRALVDERRGVRLVLATLAGPLVARRRFEPLGFRSLGDYARERLGVSAVVVREWARVATALGELPELRAAVVAGEVSWSVARRAVAFASPESDAAFAAALRGRTVRAAELLLRAAFGAATEHESTAEGQVATGDERVTVRVPLARSHHGRWQAALELARRMAGESLPVWECAEAMAAEALSTLPPSRVTEAAQALTARSRDLARPGVVRPARIPRAAVGAEAEHGLRHEAFPIPRWHAPGGGAPLDLVAVREWAELASPHALDGALRRALVRLEAVDHDLGHLLRQVADRRLYAELGFTSFERYAVERVDVSPRTARRWVRMARLAPVGSAVSVAIRSGSLTPQQATLVAEAAAPPEQAGLVEHAKGVTLRRLEDDLGGARAQRAAIAFSAPREVANVFHLALESVRRHLESEIPAGRPGCVGAEQALLWMLEHAIAAWEAQGEQFDDYADFTRDGFRCTAPGCMARRNLQSHHIVFRSAGGADDPSNRTTLCAFHHLRGIHAGSVSCRGHAPDGLVFALGVRTLQPPLLRVASEDVLLRS